jgi:hypothetical protein
VQVMYDTHSVRHTWKMQYFCLRHDSEAIAKGLRRPNDMK